MSRRVALDALVHGPEAGGLGVYIDRLIDYFARNRVDIDLRVFISRRTFRSFGGGAGRDSLLPVPVSPSNPVQRILAEPLLWPRLLRRYGVELFHSPMSYVPFGVSIPSVVTIHDMRAFHFPESYPVARRAFIRAMMARTLRRAITVFASSEFTKGDITRVFDVDPEKITVIYLGLDREAFARPRDEAEWARTKERLRLPDEYILSIGHLEPRKNYVRLLEAYRLLRERWGTRHALVIVGRENWHFKEIYAAVDRLRLGESVRFTKFVAADELPALYRHASLFVTASLYEGFGLTPLESMAARTPAVVSNRTSLPEVVGDAALLIDPLDAGAMADAMHAALTDEALRRGLIERGERNILRFDWDACCRRVGEEYLKALRSLS
jgi:glycosyltransferase involved in cell wall biosynthesis